MANAAAADVYLPKNVSLYSLTFLELGLRILAFSCSSVRFRRPISTYLRGDILLPHCKSRWVKSGMNENEANRSSSHSSIQFGHLSIPNLIALRLDFDKQRISARVAKAPFAEQMGLAEAKLRVERCLGAKLAQANLRQRRSSDAASDEPTTLSGWVISQNDSTRWQQLAKVPENVFADYLATCRWAQSLPSARALRQLANSAKKPSSADGRSTRTKRIDSAVTDPNRPHAVLTNRTDQDLLESLLGHAESLQLILAPLHEGNEPLSDVEQRTICRYADETVSWIRQLLVALRAVSSDDARNRNGRSYG